MSNNRFKDALEQINNMNFNTGRADLLGLEVREVIRRAFHPDEQCPQCNGAGEVLRTLQADHGSCRNWESRGPYNGWCKKLKEYRDECGFDVCSMFDDRWPTEKCPSCNGKPIKTKEEIPIGVSHKHDFFENIDLEDSPPTKDN